MSGSGAETAPPRAAVRGQDSTRERFLVAAFFFVVAAIVAGSAKPGIRGYDAEHRIRQIQSWRTSADVPFDRKYGVALPALAFPLYVAAEMRSEEAARAAVAQFNHLVTFAFCVWLWRWHRARLGAPPADAAAGVLCVLFTSWLLAHGGDFYSEPVWSALACVFLDSVCAGKPRGIALAAAALVVVNPALAPVCLLAASSAGRGRASLFAAGLGIAVGALATGAENLFERGRFLDSGYGEEKFLWQPRRVIDLLISPGRGLLLFAPACLLVPWIPTRPESRVGDRYAARFFRAASVFIAGLVALYGSWWWWCGGHFFGPRFLLAASVSSGMALGWSFSHRRTLSPRLRTLGGALAIVSAFVAWFGVAVGHRFAQDCPSPTLAHDGWNESPAWLFTRPAAEWLELLAHRATVSFGAGLLLAVPIIRALGREHRSG